MSRHVVIVGASIGGLATAEALRDEGFDGRVTLVGDEPWAPYSRPALSKQVLSGAWDVAPLRSIEEVAERGIEVRIGQRAEELDLGRRVLRVGGERLVFDELVVATGVAARRSVPGALTLRSLDDALRLRTAISDGARVVLVGGSVLACEIASTAAARGASVVLLVRGPALALRGLGRSLSDRLAARLLKHGVEIRTGARALGVDRHGVALGDGSVVAADVCVAAVGSEPCVGWLHGSGLRLVDGVCCDDRGRAAPGVHAVGDVASWIDPFEGRRRRIEHQQNAIEQGQAVARDLVGAPHRPTAPPFFWTTVCDVRVQVHGDVTHEAELEVVSGSLDSDRFVVAVRGGSRSPGLVGWNAPREFRLARSRMSENEEVSA